MYKRQILDKANPFPILDTEFGDIVGTGGDHSNLINVSTLSTFVAAAAGVKMAKHGNRSVSSKCGSFDLLEVLEVPFNIELDNLKHMFEQHGVCFLFAPLFHPSFKHVVPIRKKLKTRTIFNILGPLVNPARPSFQVLGVYANELLEPMAQASQKLGLKQGLIVHGAGLDEIAPHADTSVIELKNDRLTSKMISPKDFGFDYFSKDKVAGGEKEENLIISQEILSGKGTIEQQMMIAMNVAPLLVMARQCQNYKQAASYAMDILKTDSPIKLIQKMKLDTSK